MPLDWRGKEVLDQIAKAALAAVDEFDLRVEAAAKRELYPGHGVRTGTLRRGIQASPARHEGSRVVGSVGVKGVKYALRIHYRYQYITNGFDRVRPSFQSIYRRHLGR